MGDTTIRWLFRPGTRPRSWNPTQGCEMVSPGCKNCYAMRMAARFAKDGWSQGLIDLKTKKWSREGRLATHKLTEPLTWREPSTVFVNSMSDLFWEKFTDEEIAAVFGIMAACQRHTFIIATKRAKRMREWFEHHSFAVNWHHGLNAWRHARGRVSGLEISAWDGEFLKIAHTLSWPLPNVWLLVSVENQEMADERIPHLLATPAAVRGISAEPLLEGLDLRRVQHERTFEVDALTGDHGVTRPLKGRGPKLDWVITGCESGPGARPAQTDWFRSLRDQCKAAGVPFFLKQGNVKMEGITANAGETKPGGVGEPAALDGVFHQEWPW